MASNSSLASHNITSPKHQRSPPTSSCIPWCAVLSIECLAIVILNITTITVFVKQRQLQRKSTYLIIHLAIADLLVGAISGPMQVHAIMAECYGKIWDITFSRISLAIRPFFPFASLVNLAFISLERVHATYRPFKASFNQEMVVWTSYSFYIFINNMQRYNRNSNRLAIKRNLGLLFLLHSSGSRVPMLHFHLYQSSL